MIWPCPLWWDGVGNWRAYPKARILHDRVKGEIKLGPVRFAEMELVNRHFVMTRVLDRHRPGDYGHLLAYELFSLVSMLDNPTWAATIPACHCR